MIIIGIFTCSCNSTVPVVVTIANTNTIIIVTKENDVYLVNLLKFKNLFSRGRNDFLN